MLRGLLLEAGSQIGFELRPVLVLLSIDECLLRVLVLAIGEVNATDRNECANRSSRQGQDHVSPSHGVCHSRDSNQRGGLNASTHAPARSQRAASDADAPAADSW